MLLNCGVFRRPGAPRRTVFHAQGPDVGESEQPCGGVDIPARGRWEESGQVQEAGLRWFPPPGLSGKGLRPSWDVHIGSAGCYPALNTTSPKL